MTSQSIVGQRVDVMIIDDPHQPTTSTYDDTWWFVNLPTLLEKK